MNQIWTNPSVQRSLITNETVSNLITCLKISKSGKEVLVFPNMEYNFTFYDGSTGLMHSITGLVVDVYEDQIKIKYLNNTAASVCKCCRNRVTNNAPMPTCHCILNPPDVSRYDGPGVLFIPIMNILNISYITTHNPSFNKNNGGIRVMLLGVSATTVKAVIVKLAFFDDNYEETAKLVDLKVDNMYDITYESADGSINEIHGKVVSIEEISNNICCRTGKGYVRENVGCHNSIYTSYTCSKDEFMQAPPVKKIKITLDTSEIFAGLYESIMLDMIRDCTLVTEGSNKVEDTANDYCDICIYKAENCDPNSCGHYIPSESNAACCYNRVYSYEYDTHTVTVAGDKICIIDNTNDITVESDMDTILKHYLGVAD